MRPYQIYAVKAAKRRVLESNQNGYVFACTGSGKTLTSFKLAQLFRDEPRIDKVIFLIDRKDLDDQTVDEYNSFEKDCVDRSDSTKVLIHQMKETGRKMIVTTIQKMAHAVTNPKYVVYILNLLKEAQKGEPTEEEKANNVDLVLREIERSDNDALRAKKDILESFIKNRFYLLPKDADIQQAFTEFEKESLQAELENFADEKGIKEEDISGNIAWKTADGTKIGELKEKGDESCK